MSSPYANMVHKLNRVYSLPDGCFVAELETISGELERVEDYSPLGLYNRVCQEMLHLPTGTMQVNVKFLQLLVSSASALKIYEQNLLSDVA
jgi:hypothetical protein